MTSQENAEIVRRWWAGFNEGRLPPLELCDAEIEIRNPDEFPLPGPYHGHQGLQDWVAEVWDVIEDHHVAVEGIIQAPDKETVVIALRSTGRSKEMQIDVDVPWAALWVIRGGKLAHAHGYLTMDEAREAADLTE